jgi:hypothetical protein
MVRTLSENIVSPPSLLFKLTVYTSVDRLVRRIQERQRVKYGHDPHVAQNQESARWQNQQQFSSQSISDICYKLHNLLKESSSNFVISKVHKLAHIFMQNPPSPVSDNH